MINKLSQDELNKLNNMGKTVGSEIHFFTELTSTFDKIRQMDLKDGLTVVCSRQTSGSGRLGRTWESPDGGIYFTFALMPPFNSFDTTFITLICAVGVQRTLEKYVPCKIKWPNDIVSEGKKLCGILTRSIVINNTVNCILVGIGINANNCIFSKGVPHATSLKLILKREINENLLFAEVINEIDKLYANGKSDDILTAYIKNCINIDKDVTIHYLNSNSDVKGRCIAILADGSMNVQTESSVINVSSGEVSVKGIYE